MREASIQEQPAQEQPSPPREAPPRSVLEYRYALYSAAYDARMGSAGANALLAVYARTNRCRRAAEVIALAESQAENGFPKLAVEHLDARQGSCPHCVRASCLSAELFPAASEPPERLVAEGRPSAAPTLGSERARRAFAPRSLGVAIVVAVILGAAAMYAVAAT